MIAAGPALVTAIACERLVELVLARRNTRRLLARGAVEWGRGHYPLFVLLHALWLGAVFAVAVNGAPIHGLALAALAVLVPLRLWVMISLGPFWTTRIITLADAPLVRRGPYRYCRHPNYAVVAAEIAVLPLVFGAWPLALGFSLVNAGLTALRIRVEDHALEARRAALTARGRIAGAG